MLKVKQFLDENFFSLEGSTAKLKQNGHYEVHGNWTFPSPDKEEFLFCDIFNGRVRKNSIWCSCNNETIRIRVSINGKYTGLYDYLQTYEHIPRGEPDTNGYYRRSTDEEVIRYITTYVDQIREIQTAGQFKSHETGMYKLYLDDERFPKLSDDWTIVRNFEKFKKTILDSGLPSGISFDHDLGENEPTGYDCLKWMVYEMQYDLRNVDINVHSANPVGRDNIEGLVKSWNKFLDQDYKKPPSAIDIADGDI
jgi:hypothetical protein